MDRVFFVKNGDLETVNKELASGGFIKGIYPVAESVSIASQCRDEAVGDVYAYIVIEYPNKH